MKKSARKGQWTQLVTPTMAQKTKEHNKPPDANKCGQKMSANKRSTQLRQLPFKQPCLYRTGHWRLARALTLRALRIEHRLVNDTQVN